MTCNGWPTLVTETCSLSSYLCVRWQSLNVFTSRPGTVQAHCTPVHARACACARCAVPVCRSQVLARSLKLTPIHTHSMIQQTAKGCTWAHIIITIWKCSLNTEFSLNATVSYQWGRRNQKTSKLVTVPELLTSEFRVIDLTSAVWCQCHCGGNKSVTLCHCHTWFQITTQWDSQPNCISVPQLITTQSSSPAREWTFPKIDLLCVYLGKM